MAVEIARAAKEALSGQTARNRSLEFDGVCFALKRKSFGVTWSDCLIAGQLLGERLALNEFISYLNLVKFQQDGAFSDSKSVAIATYALCGFANLTSVGIQIGGIGSLEKTQRPTLLK